MFDPYFALAEYYDTFTGNVDYGRRAAFLDGKLSQFGSKGIVLDAGCGSGEISRFLLGMGYDVIGVDISESMLSVARDKNPEQLLLCQDLTELDLYGTVQGVVCTQDTLNHLESREDFRKVISNFSLFAESESRIIFDLNTKYKHYSVLADNSFVLEDENAMFVWQNYLDPDDGSVSMDMDLFVLTEDGLYDRTSTSMTEILLDDEFVRKTCIDCGLEVLETVDGETYGPVTETSQRIMYITRKV